MPLIEVNLQGSLNTEADELLVGFQGFTQLKNLEQDTSGQLKQRLGFINSASGITGDRELSAVKHIVDSRLTNSFKDTNGTLLNAAYNGTAWIVCARQNGGNDFQILLCDPATYGNQVTLQTLSGALLKHSVISDYGNGFIRIGLDIDTTPTVLQYIERDFFWGSYDYDNRWYYDTTNFPRLDASYVLVKDTEVRGFGGEGASIASAYFGRFTPWIAEHLNRDGMENAASKAALESAKLGFTTGLDLSANTYFYKLCPVFDGLQEGLLPNGVTVDTSTLSTGTKTPRLTFEFDFSGSNWNPRTSGFNLYRSTSGNGTYNKVLDISAKKDDANLVHVTDASIDRVVHIEGANFTVNEHQNKDLLVNGMSYTISSNTADTLTLSADLNGGTVGDSTGFGVNRASQLFGAGQRINDTSTDWYGIGSFNGQPNSIYDEGVIGGTVYWNSELQDHANTGANRVFGGNRFGVWAITETSELKPIDQFTNGICTSGTGGDSVTTSSSAWTNWKIREGTGSAVGYDGVFSDRVIRIDGDGSASNDADLGPNITFAAGQYYVMQATVSRSGGSTNRQSIKLKTTTGLTVQNSAIELDGTNGPDFYHHVVACTEDNTNEDNNNSTGWGDTTSDIDTDNNTESGLAVGTQRRGFVHVQIIFKYDSETSTGFKYERSANATSEFVIASLSVRQLIYSTPSKLYGGVRMNTAHTTTESTNTNGLEKSAAVVVSPSFDFAEDEMNGAPVIVATPSHDTSYPKEEMFHSFVAKTSRRALVIPGITFKTASSVKVWVAKNYQWYRSKGETTKAKLRVYDTGLTSGALHPLAGTSSLQTNYKYASVLNGRTFVGNVRITNGAGDTEDHADWVMYSLVNQPDVIPISNYIQLEDLQGGNIVGLEVLLSDLIVFMERGIFRLSVPSTDPSQWSLIEAYPNIGCLNHLSIVKTDLGIIFCSLSGIYLLDASFSLKALHMPIKSKYEANATADGTTGSLVGTKLGWDEKSKKLYVLYDLNKSQIANIYDFKTETWSEIQSYIGGATNINRVVLNNELKPYFHISADDGTSASFYTYDATSTESITAVMETGVLQLSENQTRKSRVGKIIADVSNTVHDTKPTEITVSGGNSIAGADLKSASLGTGIVSARIGRRSEGAQIKIQRSSSNDENFEINKVTLEVE